MDIERAFGDVVALWLAVVLGLVTLLWLRKRVAVKRRLPPGPFNLPWLGYLLSIDKVAPYETFANLSRKYGKMYGLKLGSLYSVFLSDPDLIRRAFSRDVFSGRAPLYLTHGIMKGQGLICAEGDAWREHRRFVIGVMKQLGMSGRQGASVMESRIMDRVVEFVRGLEESAGRGDPVDLVPALRHCIGNMVNGVVFGRTYSSHDPTWLWLQHLLDEGVKLVAVAGPINFLPVLRFLPQYRNVMPFILKGQAETHRHYREIIDEHQRHLGDNQEYGNVIEAYLLEMKRRRERTGGDSGSDSFDMSQLYHVLADLFGAGTDTALTTIKWIVLYIMLYPDVQDRMHDEIDRVIGDGRTPCHASDAHRMPYTDAVSCEVQRIKSILPLGVPHGTLDDCELDGYFIPKGTMVVPLIGAMNHDAQLWPEPEVFRPERFLSVDETSGETVCKRPDHFMPFQCGRRACIGEHMGRAVVFLFTVTLLQRFRLSFPDGFAYDLDAMRPEYGFTLVPHPYPVLLTPKNHHATATAAAAAQ